MKDTTLGSLRIEDPVRQGDAAKAKAEHSNQPSKLLVPTDLSDLDRLAPQAFALAATNGSQVIFLHVVTATSSMAVDGAGIPIYNPEAAVEYATRRLDQLCNSGRARSIPTFAIVREGVPLREIMIAARQFRVDQVMLATRSRGRLGKLILGSVAEQVFRSLYLPVITIGPAARSPHEYNGNTRSVLHATALGDDSLHRALAAGQLAAAKGARLVLLHVLADDAHGVKFADSELSAPFARTKALEQLAAQIAEGCRVEVSTCLVHGEPAIEILAQAHDCDAEMIVLGAREGSIFDNLTRERTIDRVLAHAQCPVLTLHEPPHALAQAAEG